jgi:hypothetical protein
MPDSCEDESCVLTELEDLERKRCESISQYDWVVLESILHEDFVYGFLSGRLEGKSVYLQGLPSRPHGVTSKVLETHIYGEVAVMVSEFASTNASSGAIANEGTALAVWIRSGDTWKIVAYHSTKFGISSTGEQISSHFS